MYQWVGADLGGGCRGYAPPTETKLPFVFNFKFVFLTSQQVHSLVVHPILRKMLDRLVMSTSEFLRNSFKLLQRALDWGGGEVDIYSIHGELVQVSSCYRNLHTFYQSRPLGFWRLFSNWIFFLGCEDELKGLYQDWVWVNQCRSELIRRKRDLEIM